MTDDAIIYTHTDEAPALATASFLPIIQAYAGQAGIAFETRDISLGGRILSAFPQKLTPEQQVGDALAELGGLATLPEANIIKLPNISASIPQLKGAIAELQQQGYDIPDFPDEPSTLEEKDVRARYDRIKGSAVNPVLREGNSDRRAPLAVKNYAKKHPHRNKPFAEGSKTRVATMGHDDFKSNERSWVAAHDDVLTFRHTAEDGTVTVLKEGLKVLPREIIDATFLSAKALDAFLDETLESAKADDVLYSVHLKATMMKVSDPIIFGHVVKAFFKDVFEQYGEQLAAAGLSANDGLGSILTGLANVTGGDDIAAAFDRAIAEGPRLSYVNSDKGTTNLHVPSDVIVDASMPALVRNGGKLWGKDGGEADTLAVIPDSSYASVYQAVIDDVIANGPLDPATIGTVPNVGLMAQAAEEYGSHDKTFEIEAPGTVQVLDSEGTVLIEHTVGAGDIWRATQTKHIPVMDWVKLAVNRARASGVPAVFWLDANRSHDAQIIAKVHQGLATLDTKGLTITILAPEEATRYTLARGCATGSTRSRSPATCCATTSRISSRSSRWAPAPRCSRSFRCSRAADCSRPVPGAPRPSTCSSWSRRTTSAGTRWASSSRWPLRSSTMPTARATRRPACSRRLSTPRPGRSSRRTAPRGVPSARSTTAAATSTSACTGRRSWRSRPRMPISRRPSRRSRPRSPRRRRRSSPSSTRCRGSLSRSVATTDRTMPSSRRSCARRKR
ncbi:isocitrate dehydrogenase [Microbacterium sp. W4I20]|nr:isocitrate dehydrogenase [Microbacterium sp. W4I20]